MDPNQSRNSFLGQRKETWINKENVPSANINSYGKEAAPSYESKAQEISIEELNAAFSSLYLTEHPSAFPTADECLAHLKLLSVFHGLKEDVGYADGLFDLWDVRCERVDEKDKELTLSKMREKRWALYVARAVERFEDWWMKVLCAEKTRLTWKGMLADTPAFANFTEVKYRVRWTKEMLPPIDVLMVWHTFMLNPRSYLEDCIRFGLPEFWVAGMPWHVINEAIDNTNFVYDVPEEGKTQFTAKTGHNWSNAQDPMFKKLYCPRCYYGNQFVPWTTCASENLSAKEITTMTGTGYGDPEFSWACLAASHKINHDFLVVDRFKKDVENVRNRDFPMRGTILTPSTGKTDGPTAENWDNRFNTFPNRLAKLGILDDVTAIMKRPQPTMEDVKKAIERAINDKEVVKKVNTKMVNGKEATGDGVLSKQEKVAVRKMMSCYWDNCSIFSLELGSAVVRQAVFVDKMYTIDWLHSPNARQTMDRLIEKYRRFMKIIGEYPKKLAVPTLDVDLGWHTHQLSPKSYYDYSVSKCRKFVNHDDKLEEDKLAEGFEWTSKKYQKMFHEVYSECTSIRSSHISSTAKVLRLSTQEKVLNEFHSSGRAQFCPPNKSAHISSHNAVYTMHASSIRASVHAARRRRKEQELDEAYKKAEKRAAAKGRKIPPKEEYYYVDTWGYPYIMYGPWQPYPCTGTLYVGGDPCLIPGEGLPGNCAAGACAGGVGVGACGGPGGSACGNACGSACGGGCGGGCGGCGGCG